MMPVKIAFDDFVVRGVCVAAAHRCKFRGWLLGCICQLGTKYLNPAKNAVLRVLRSLAGHLDPTRPTHQRQHRMSGYPDLVELELVYLRR